MHGPLGYEPNTLTTAPLRLLYPRAAGKLEPAQRIDALATILLPLPVGVRPPGPGKREEGRRFATSRAGFPQKGSLAHRLPRRHPRELSSLTAVGFEPTQLALVELESTPLDHSGKLSCSH